ncbi:pyridoxamine 5'-phosphate oxidase family protein [bacterium]|nr:MAG: pyridoxamine 5'-phosphate oxidase family protein [bacterium]
MTLFHAGEVEVQERVGVRAMAERVGGIIRSTMPPAAQQFLRAQPFVVIGGEGGDGRVWATLLSGEPGFAQAVDEGTIQLDAVLPEDDPLYESLKAGAAIGMIALEPATRRRMRLNGWARSQDGGIVFKAQQVYSNCPKYIQKREWHREAEEDLKRESARSGALLEERQMAWIAGADTFFIASRAEEGADASHRGGTPGFVRVLGPDLLQFPDYVGNAMFNTLGNLQSDSRAGLLFIDWRSGATLQVAGRARVLWDDEIRGAERGVELRVERVLERQRATALRWEFVEASPFNPAVLSD